MMGSVSFGDVTLTRDWTQENIARGAAALASLGGGKGDGIAVMMRNEPGFIEASMAASYLGAYSIPVNWHAVPADLAHILSDSGAKVLVIHADMLPAVSSGIGPNVQVVVVETPPEVVAAYGIDPAAASVPEGCTNWLALRATSEPRSAPSEPVLQVIFYTSGTTGKPKGIKRFLDAQQFAVLGKVMARSYGLFGDHADPETISTVVTGPMYHGLPNGHAHFCYRAGANITIMPRFDPEGLLRLIEEKRVTHLNLVPIMFHRLLALPEEMRRKYDLSSLRFVGHAAAPISPTTKRAMIEWWGPIIHEYYGATEVGNVAFCTSEEWLAHPGTVGKVPEGTQVRIVDDHGRGVPAGETGHIACRIDGMGDMTYLNQEDARRDIELVPGFITAGDIGYFDADGFLFICDRSKDMIISGGVNIYPAQIEAALLRMPGVSDCAVFGIPNEEFGESVHAVIEPAVGASLDAEAVKEFLRQHVAGFMIPKSIDFATGLPRDDSGKFFKRKLREPFWQDVNRRI